MKKSKSQQLFARAQNLFPGGVNSPVRAFGSVGSEPPFIARGEGAHLEDADGNRYLDYVLSWGPLILGHAHPMVLAALTEAAQNGTSYGAPCAAEIALAEKVQAFMPALEMMRFVNSGTEATMSAVRLARGFTGREKFVKFEGHYHGHADQFLVKAGSGVATLGIPGSPGVPQGSTRDTLSARFNHLETVEAQFKAHPDQIAAVILEPVGGNMGMVPPKPEFLQGLQALCQREGALLIFDEVMTGFRVHPGGAHTLYGIEPDLITLGKVIGGGLPVGAYGGRKEIMEHIAPSGPVYQAGTLSGNPLAMSAGLATLEEIEDPAVWQQFDQLGKALTTGLQVVAEGASVDLQVAHLGSMFGFFFHWDEVESWDEAAEADTKKFAQFHRGMMERGIYLAPSQYESGFLSTAHTEADIKRTVDAAAEVFTEL